VDRVQIGAIALAVVLLVGSVYLTPPAPPEPVTPPSAAATPNFPDPSGASSPVVPPPSSTPTESAAVVPAEPQVAARETKLTNGQLELVVDNQGGAVRRLALVKYADRVAQPGEPVQPVDLVTVDELGVLLSSLGNTDYPGLERARFDVVEEAPRKVVHRLRWGGSQVTRTLEIDESGYGGNLWVKVENLGDKPVRPSFEIVLDGRDGDISAPDHFQNFSLVASVDGTIERRPLLAIGSPGWFSRMFGSARPDATRHLPPVEWVGVDSQYFLLAVIPDDASKSWATYEPTGTNSGRSILGFPYSVTGAVAELPPGQQLERHYRLYFGPKIPDLVNAVDPRLEPAVVVGWTWVQPLVHLFASMLKWMHDHLIANYGIAIILITIMLRLVVYPLNQRSMKSMKRMSVIAPEMKAIQDKYKDDPTRLQQELMSLYRRQGMNPLSAMGGGCIPMLIQMPFMIALYFALQSSIELRHAPFAFWINDLSAPENLFSIAGLPIRPLPLMMGGAMIAQQWLTPSTADAQQRQMMLIMSAVFTLVFYQFPSGLVLYWLVSTLLGILQQVMVNQQPLPAKA
jgi:YidC/Oxa1 family membrane protein insertase